MPELLDPTTFTPGSVFGVEEDPPVVDPAVLDPSRSESTLGSALLARVESCGPALVEVEVLS